MSAAEATGPGRVGLFAYGSLAGAGSLATTLGRPPGKLLPVRLEGWRRTFSLLRDNHRSEKTFARGDDGSIPDWILSLNVERATGPGEGPNGVLFGVSAAELERLDLREMRYERREVTGDIEGAGAAAFDRIVTYVARPERFCSRPPGGTVILRSYVEAVEGAFAELEGGELAAYRRTTQAPPVEVVAGSLVRDAIPEGNPRAW